MKDEMRRNMIESMAKVRLVSPRTLVNGVTSTLQEIGVLHIESGPGEAARIPLLRPQVLDESARERQTDLERLRDDLRRLFLLLPEISSTDRIRSGHDRHLEFPEEGIKQVSHVIREIAESVDVLSTKLKACEEELVLLSKYETALAALAPFLRFIQESEELDHFGLMLDEREGHDHLVPLLRELMGNLTDNRYELFHAKVNERSLVVLLVFPRAHSAKVRGLLWEEGITELRLPASVSEKPLGEALHVLLQKKAELPLEAVRLRQELTDIACQWRQELAQYQKTVLYHLAQIEASTLFYQTGMTTFIYGWVPRRLFDMLRRRMSNALGGKVVLEECPLDRHEWPIVPVVLRNPEYLRPFETLTRLIALPRYGSIDPTPYMAVFFPLFYGIILGDVGYGLLLLAAAATIRRRFASNSLVRDFSTMFIFGSISAIVFGLLFGELLGEIGERIGLHPILNRMEAFIPLLAISIGIGTLHIALGIVLGAYSAWREGSWRSCIAKVGGLILILSFIALIASAVGLAPRGWIAGESASVICSLAIIFGFGRSRGAMELHNLVNVLSYLRLMGIGVASAALAFAANKLGGMAGNAILAIAIAGSLHAINLALGIFSPTIQSLRLHYVEFFENFFVPGGPQYRPFKRQEV